MHIFVCLGVPKHDSKTFPTLYRQQVQAIRSFVIFNVGHRMPRPSQKMGFFLERHVASKTATLARFLMPRFPSSTLYGVIFLTFSIFNEIQTKIIPYCILLNSSYPNPNQVINLVLTCEQSSNNYGGVFKTRKYNLKSLF